MICRDFLFAAIPDVSGSYIQISPAVYDQTAFQGKLHENLRHAIGRNKGKETHCFLFFFFGQLWGKIGRIQLHFCLVSTRVESTWYWGT